MTIRQKIHLSNILMMILPIAATAFFIAICLETSLGDYWCAKETNWGQGIHCSIAAVHRGKENQEVISYLQDYMIKYVWWFLGFFVMAAISVHGVLSWWISKSVLLPLRRLKLGTRQIREGNLDEVIDYGKNDEFGEVCRDFDEMRIYLKESVEQRIEDEERKRALIIGISHDLRTPLTSILGYLDGLLGGIANTPEKQERYFRAIQVRTQDLSRLVESLSEYNRLDSRSFQYELRPDDLIQFLEEYMKGCQEEVKQNKIEYLLEYGRIKTCPVLIDRNELKRVFDNLFINTVRYREKESSRVRISVRTTENQNMAECIFADNGPGVPEESLGRLFDSFYRVDGARSNAGEGSGIGLAIVKEIINGHKGNVWAENHDGLSVVIQLPMIGIEEA